MRLEITNEEREELVRLLDSYLSDTRVETRRTDNHDYREMLHHEEDILRGLIAKLRDETPDDMRLAG